MYKSKVTADRRVFSDINSSIHNLQVLQSYPESCWCKQRY